MSEDRTLKIAPNRKVETAWISIDDCILGSRERMDFAAIERAGRKCLQSGDCQSWPPIVGHWQYERVGSRFIVCDGRHELLALMALGRERVFVAWIVEIQ